MEITSVKSFLDYYDKIRERTIRVINVIPPAGIDFTYMPGKFSIADEIRHIAGIERYMFAETIAGRVSAYPGCGKELADGYEKVMRYFTELHMEDLAILKNFSDNILSRKCTNP